MSGFKPLHIDRGNAITASPKATGRKKQNPFHATIKYALTKEVFGFDSYSDSKSFAKLNEAKVNKDVVIFYRIQTSENASVEPTYYEAGNVKVETKEFRKGLKAKHHLDSISHASLKSYQGSDYTRIIEFTRDNKMKLVLSDEKLKGQLLSNFIVGPMMDPLIEGELGSTTVEMVYADFNEFEDHAQVIIPDYKLIDLEGIFELNFEIESSTETEVKFKAYTLDGEEVVNLVIGNFALLKADGTVQDNITAISYTDGSYVATGTGFVTGTINTSGVVDQTKKAYEGVAESYTIS